MEGGIALIFIGGRQILAVLGEQQFRRIETERLCQVRGERSDRQGDHLRAIVEHAHELPAPERALVSLAATAAGAFVAQLRDRGEMDFDRMITWTRDLIRDDEAVRRTLRRRIRVLIIDEFQDVDPVQREIAYLLGDPASGATAPTRLMLVGDPEQRLYSFRKADVRGWKSVQRDFPGTGEGSGKLG